jgi:hypothetical protein
MKSSTICRRLKKLADQIDSEIQKITEQTEVLAWRKAALQDCHDMLCCANEELHNADQ